MLYNGISANKIKAKNNTMKGKRKKPKPKVDFSSHIIDIPQKSIPKINNTFVIIIASLLFIICLPSFNLSMFLHPDNDHFVLRI